MKEDALWRATPGGVWGLVMAELFRGMGEQIPDAPAATWKTPSATVTGRKYADEKQEQWNEIAKMTAPGLSWYYEEESLGGDRYRTGGKSLEPAVQLTMSTSFQDSWSEEECARVAERDTEVWKINPDFAQKITNGKITGTDLYPPHTGTTTS